MMKTKIITVVAAAVILSFTEVQLYAVPVDKISTSSGERLDGEEWNNVSIYNDATIVDMLGLNLNEGAILCLLDKRNQFLY